MQRSYPLRWLALAIGLLGTQCLDSISDDCTKTLTCSDQQPTLQPNCEWRYPDGSVWVGGPRYDEATKTWRWPDGKETDTQDFKCSIGDAGADAGPAGPDCRRPDSPCDLPYVCDLDTGACVECLEDSECSGATPVGDAGAANVCDKIRHECVQCLVNDNCLATGDTPICKVDVSDSTRNECVQCQAERDCGGATPACDVNTNECTTRCSTPEECGGDKRFCKVADRICVECLAPGDCAATSTNSQCNVATSECVECVDDSPCAANGEVCDTTRNRCVQCREDVQCAGTPATSHCDTQTNLCVQCLDDLQCSNEASSRCNVAAHVCVGCTADSQCENGLRCNQAPGGGTCVECVDSGDCVTGLERTCETTSGQCVECLNTSQCLGVETAHCKTEPGGNPMEPLFSCVGCLSEADCGNKPIPGFCREGDGVCVNCETNAECFPNASLSRCGNDGNCGICSVDLDCALFTSPGLGRRACKEGEGCVECVTEDHCATNTAAPHCKVTDTGASAGDAAVNTCVQCRSNTDCTTAGASVCSNNECVACADGVDAGCSHIDSNGATAGVQPGICAAGACVQCTGLRRTACGLNVCDSLAKTCSNRPARGAPICGGCVADDECATNARCVQQAALGGGFFCVPIQSGALCPNSGDTRGFLRRASIATIDTASGDVCLPQLASCPAFVNYRDGTPCEDAADDDACGQNGSCAEQLASGDFFCTIGCTAVGDCVRGTCNDDLCTL